MRGPNDAPPGKLLTFWSVGWVFVVLVGLLGLMAWQVVDHLGEARKNRITDRFPRTNLKVPASELTVVKYRDFIPARTNPGSLSIEEVEESPKRWLAKLLVPSDPVIGVAIGDEARAYPLRVLNWHEVVNDTLGGTPIAVTWHPLTAGAAVFDRRVGGEVLELRVSGLLFQSAQILYDRRDEIGTESLWLQLGARAIAGPEAGKDAELTTLPFAVVTWEVWRARYPKTTITAPDPVYHKHYARRPYASYYGTREPRYPVKGYPPEGVEGLWDRVAWIVEGDAPRLVPVEEIPTGDIPPMLFYALRWAWIATRN